MIGKNILIKSTFDVGDIVTYKDNTDRIDLFESEYDSRINDVKGNLDWIKTNIKGHNYFKFTNSESISFREYVDELPEEAFEDLLEFLNNLPYFNDKKL